MIRSASVRRVCALVLALAGWFALGLQWHLTHAQVIASGRSGIAALGVFFSFFTILTNLLAAICLTALAFVPVASDRLARFTSSVAVYITVVGVVYSLLLRHIWAPVGWQKVADVLLHDAMPVLFVLFWLTFVPKGRLRWVSPVWWLIYPLAYLGMTLVRGMSGAAYPYPFVDVAALGYGRVMLNSLGLTLGFLALGFAFVGVDKWIARRSLGAGLPYPLRPPFTR
ncbi:MAG: Pr6Pr family membrane protein [Silvibacterium sp.]